MFTDSSAAVQEYLPHLGPRRVPDKGSGSMMHASISMWKCSIQISCVQEYMWKWFFVAHVVFRRDCQVCNFVVNVGLH